MSIAIRNWLGKPSTFWVLMIGAFAVRVVLIVANWNTPLVSDALYYDGVGNAIAGGYDFEPYWPPGLTNYLAGWKLLFGTDQGISRLAMLPWFFFLALAIRSILRQLASNLPANLAILVLSFFPALIHHSIEPLSQLPTAALLALAFDQYLRFREHRGHTAVQFAGIFLALAVLFRPSCLLLAAIWPLWCAWRRPRFAAALLPIALIIGTTVNFISQKHDRFVLLNDANARNIYLGNTPWTDWYKTWYFGSHWTLSPLNPEGLRTELSEIRDLPINKRNRAFLKATWKHTRQDPGMFFVRTTSRIRTFFAFDSFSGARLINQGKQIPGYIALFFDGLLFLLTMVLTLRWLFLPPRPARPFFRRDVVMLILLFAFPYFLSFSHPTYHLPLLPLFIAFAALAGANLWRRKHGGVPEMGDPIKGARRWKVALLILALIQVEWIVQMAV